MMKIGYIYIHLLNENVDSNRQNNTRVYLSQEGTDGFGYVMGIHNKKTKDRIGSMVYRIKDYLKNKGYPKVLELHIGFMEKYQRKGYFNDAIISLAKEMDIPIYISKGRIINPDVHKAVAKLDKTNLNVITNELGYIITNR